MFPEEDVEGEKITWGRESERDEGRGDIHLGWGK